MLLKLVPRYHSGKAQLSASNSFAPDVGQSGRALPQSCCKPAASSLIRSDFRPGAGSGHSQRHNPLFTPTIQKKIPESLTVCNVELPVSFSASDRRLPHHPIPVSRDVFGIVNVGFGISAPP